MSVEQRSGDLDLLSAVAPRTWAPEVFGVLPDGANRRRPSDVVRVGLALLFITITALSADDVGSLERSFFDVLAALPSWVHASAEFCYRVGSIGTVVVLGLAILITRRFRLFFMLVIAGALAWFASSALRSLVDAAAARRSAGLTIDGSSPEYPVIVLAMATTVLFVAAPYLLRPARRLVVALLTIGGHRRARRAHRHARRRRDEPRARRGVSPAAFHLVVGTPAATPSLDQVGKGLVGLGVTISRSRARRPAVVG